MIPAEAVAVKLAEDGLALMPTILKAIEAMTDHLLEDLTRVIEAEGRGDLVEAETIARPWIVAIRKATAQRDGPDRG